MKFHSPTRVVCVCVWGGGGGGGGAALSAGQREMHVILTNISRNHV